MQTMQVATEASDRVDIIAHARANDAFRRVIHTGAHEQVVVMTLPPDGEIGAEVHPNTDQLFIIVEGTAEARLGETASQAVANDLVFVGAGTRHNIVNRGAVPLRLITVYAPPAHAPGTVHLTKAEADAAEE
ncbi:MAG TPA: cupin domain-containing protein [Candidatus Limnocylindrales bacterium]|nr:cupin domain-containing protein [Candidatus Limnocylindrales bacterium]